jgi:hypothetical protein
VWFLVYPPEEERRMANRIPEFELATREAGLTWIRIDFGGTFADWMDTFEPAERTKCLADPEIIESYADPGFVDFLCAKVQKQLSTVPESSADSTVCAITGLMGLYDYAHMSEVLGTLDKRLRGILLVFFPGEREGNTYRFLGARTGWDYLATPILADG